MPCRKGFHLVCILEYNTRDSVLRPAFVIYSQFVNKKKCKKCEKCNRLIRSKRSTQRPSNTLSVTMAEQTQHGPDMAGPSRSRASSVTDGDDTGLNIFAEPDGFRPATPPPTEASYRFPDGSGRTVLLSLLGAHPLWGHLLWNAATIVSDYLVQERPQLCRQRVVLELGAAAGLPSIVAHTLDASVVVATDYPDPDLVSNLTKNCQRNSITGGAGRLLTEGYIWGAKTDKLEAHLPKGKRYYDLVIMSDLIFNHQAHGAMIDTLDSCLPPAFDKDLDETAGTACHDGPQALVFFSHHRPHKSAEDMQFFEQARQRGWQCVQLGRWKMEVSRLKE